MPPEAPRPNPPDAPGSNRFLSALSRFLLSPKSQDPRADSPYTVAAAPARRSAPSGGLAAGGSPCGVFVLGLGCENVHLAG
jgi:hypothetical protein